MEAWVSPSRLSIFTLGSMGSPPGVSIPASPSRMYQHVKEQQRGDGRGAMSRGAWDPVLELQSTC